VSEAIYALWGALITAAASLACGLTAFHKLGVSLRRSEHQLLAFMTGSAILSLLVFAMAAVRLARKGIFVALAAGLIYLAFRYRRTVPFEPRPAFTPRWPAVLFFAVAAPFAVLYLCTAWAPEVSPDGATYHLGNVLRFWAHRGFTPIRDIYGALPEGLEMLFLFAFSIGRHSAAALVHLAFLLALPLLIVAFSLRFQMPKAGFLAAALVFLSPVIGQDGSTAYNDVALAAAAFSVVYCIELWIERSQPAFLLLAGALSGFCFAIKYTGAFVIVYAVSQVLRRSIRRRSIDRRRVLQFALPCALMIAPWLTKNAVYMRNPVAPFFNSTFPNPYGSPRFEQDYTLSMAHYAGTASLRELAIGYTVTGARVGAFFGPLFLLAPLGLVALRFPRGRRLLLAAVLFGMPILSNGGTRFLIPAAPCLALAIGVGVADTKFAVPALILLQGITSWPTITRKYCDPAAWRIARFPARAIFDPAARSRYLHDSLGAQWDMARIIDQRLPPGGRIFCVSCPAQAYLLRDVNVYYETLENRALLDALWTPKEIARQPLKEIVLSFPRIRATRLRVVLACSRPDQLWTVTEMRFRDDGRELPRSPRWRIAASPDPWEAPFAFDNSPVSRWSAERYGAKGAFLEVAFDQPQAVDSVVLECPEDAPEQLALQADHSPVNAKVTAAPVKPPPGMRRAAVRLLESYGFEYLIMSSSDYYSDDFKKYAEFWGVRSLAEAGDWTLYRLE
jgi:hypothetical protein